MYDKQQAELLKENARLQKKIAELERKRNEGSWQDSPDRMGGCFTEEEINRANEWR